MKTNFFTFQTRVIFKTSNLCHFNSGPRKQWQGDSLAQKVWAFKFQHFKKNKQQTNSIEQIQKSKRQVKLKLKYKIQSEDEERRKWQWKMKIEKIKTRGKKSEKKKIRKNGGKKWRKLLIFYAQLMNFYSKISNSFIDISYIQNLFKLTWIHIIFYIYIFQLLFFFIFISPKNLGKKKKKLWINYKKLAWIIERYQLILLIFIFDLDLNWLYSYWYLIWICILIFFKKESQNENWKIAETIIEKPKIESSIWMIHPFCSHQSIFYYCTDFLNIIITVHFFRKKILIFSNFSEKKKKL